MWRTLRTKVSASRLRKDPASQPNTANLLKGPLVSLTRGATTRIAKKSSHQAVRGPDFSDGASTPNLTPDTSPAFSNSVELATPTTQASTLSSLQSSRRAAEADEEDDTVGDLTQGTILVHQEVGAQPQNVSQAMLYDLWDQDASDTGADAPIGLGLTTRDSKTGALFAFPSPTQLESLHYPPSPLGTAPQTFPAVMNSPGGSESTSFTRSDGADTLQVIANELLGTDPISASSSSVSITTLDSLGLVHQLPVIGGPDVLSLFQQTDFPSPPARVPERNFFDRLSPSAAPGSTELDALEGPNTTVSSLDPPAASEDAPFLQLKLPPPTLRPFELGQVLEDSALAQRRRFRQSVLHGRGFFPTRASPDEAREAVIPPSLLVQQQFKDRYPPTIGARRPILGPLPPTPNSAPLTMLRHDTRPAHLSPHLTLEEAVQLSLGSLPTPSPRQYTPRRFSGLTYLRDGVPIPPSPAADTPSRSTTGPYPARTTEVSQEHKRVPSTASQGSGRPSIQHQNGRSDAGPARAADTQPKLTDLMSPVQSPRDTPEAFYTPMLDKSDVNTAATESAVPTAAARPVHPANMACLAGCCAPASGSPSNTGAFRNVSQVTSAPWTRSPTRLLRSPSIEASFHLSPRANTPSMHSTRQVKKAKSSPELKDDRVRGGMTAGFTGMGPNWGATARATMLVQDDEGATPAKRKRPQQEHPQRKLNKSVGSLRFLARAFHRATGNGSGDADEPVVPLPRNISNMAVGHHHRTGDIQAFLAGGSLLRTHRSIDSDESWGTTALPYLDGPALNFAPPSGDGRVSSLTHAAPATSAFPLGGALPQLPPRSRMRTTGTVTAPSTQSHVSTSHPAAHVSNSSAQLPLLPE